jgi:formamidopyrimidine-DNA glycosylase
MPELPEVETIKRGLKKAIVGKKISDIKVLKSKSFQGDIKEVIGSIIKDINRRAKVLILEIQNSKTKQLKYLLIHLKMTGQLIIRLQTKEKITKGQNNKKSPFDVDGLPNKYTRVVIEFSDGSKLFFNDLRIFGWIKVVKDLEKAIGEKFGPEPLTKDFTLDYLKKVFQRSGKPIKLILLDQSKIAGVGNIYANEALFKAGVLPTRPANKLNESEIEKLKNAVITVLKEGLKYGGSSAADEAYRNVQGQKGKMQEHFKVYEREGQKCWRCSTKIKKIKMGGRGTYFCPACQR